MLQSTLGLLLKLTMSVKRYPYKQLLTVSSHQNEIPSERKPFSIQWNSIMPNILTIRSYGFSFSRD